MTTCERIKQQLDGAIEVRKDIAEELRSPNLSRGERAQLLGELKGIGSVIADLRRRYQQCINPPAPKPDLVARGFSVTRQGSTISVQGVVYNNGDAPAAGPFKIALGVQESAGPFRELPVQVPSGTSIEVGATYITPAIENIPRAAATFYMLVDEDQEISEILESNNTAQLDWRPAGVVADPDPGARALAGRSNGVVSDAPVRGICGERPRSPDRTVRAPAITSGYRTMLRTITFDDGTCVGGVTDDELIRRAEAHIRAAYPTGVWNR